MSEINIENQNPLSKIFKTTKDGKIIEELSSINNIHLYFQYLSDENISQTDKINFIKIFIEIIKRNRYIIEYFSEHNNESIYIFFFQFIFISLFISRIKINYTKSFGRINNKC